MQPQVFRPRQVEWMPLRRWEAEEEAGLSEWAYGFTESSSPVLPPAIRPPHPT